MKTLLTAKTIWLSAALAFALAAHARAELILNGGFESGFSGWTRIDQIGSDGSFLLQTGALSPINGDAVPLPPGGSQAAMTDAQGPGSHVLYQNFTINSLLSSATLGFDLFIGNRAGDFFTPDSLDFATPALNQRARVDLLLANADPFSIAPADILMNFFETNVGDPAVSGYTHHSVDITALLNAYIGQSLMLRFAETDNLFTFQYGVDNVSLQTPQVIPEPSYWITTGGLFLVIAWAGRRFRRVS